MFADAGLLDRALRHRSAGSPHNERMEFLGDALLGAIVAEALSTRLPNADEGELTRARTLVVRESALAEVARELGIGQALSLGPGELKSGGFRRDSILADALEAVMAAIYLDAGWLACRTEVCRMLDASITRAIGARSDKDPKTMLQEWLQARQLPLPDYELLETQGPDHARQFTVLCRVTQPPSHSEATAVSRKLAELAAARSVCERLGILPAADATDDRI